MKKTVVGFLLFVLLIVPAFAQEEFYDRQSLIIDLAVDSEVSIVPTGSNPAIDYLTINLSHVPVDTYNQDVVSFETTPDVEPENGAVLIEYDDPLGTIPYGYTATIRTRNKIIPITDTISFPLQSIPDEVAVYTKPGEIINSDNPAIIRQASELAAGHDDLYEVLYELAKWTNENIEYDLSTLTAEVSQQASWVLDNREGVCDELTSLFIAMARSLGIPAKFVSGVSYTTSPLFPDNWGSHGWAEIYFPTVGWVPYDVTYGQFAYVDPTHVKLKESFDSDDPSIKFRWLSHNTDVKTNQLNIDATVSSSSGTRTEPIRLTARPLRDSVTFGSWNAIEVVVENLEDYYQSVELALSRPQEVTIVGDFLQHVMLKPGETTSVFWQVQVTNSLSNEFIYTFPFSVSTIMNLTAETSFQTAADRQFYSLQDIETSLSVLAEGGAKSYSRDVDLNCTTTDNQLYAYETAIVSCQISNAGNTYLSDVEVCVVNQCQSMDLGISQTKNIQYNIVNLSTGKQDLTVTARNAQITKADFVPIEIEDVPAVQISDLTLPETVEYSDDFQISAKLDKTSDSDPFRVLVTFTQNAYQKTWSIDRLDRDRELLVHLSGADLTPDLNVVQFDIEYYDAEGKRYERTARDGINLVNVSLLERLFIEFNQMGFWFDNLSMQQLFLLMIGILVVFVAVVMIIFRQSKDRY